MEPYLLQMLGEKNHLQSRHCVSKMALENRVLDCGFHSYIKQEACLQFVPFLKDKAEFTEHNDPARMDLEVRADLYVFSPTEIKRIARDVDAETGMRNAEIKDLHRTNDGQFKLIQRLEKELDHLQKLSIDIAMCAPPPVYIVDTTRIKELEGILKAQEGRVNERIMKLEDEVAEKEERIQNQAKSIGVLQGRERDREGRVSERVEELEIVLSGEQRRISDKTDIIIKKDTRIAELEKQHTNHVGTILAQDKHVEELKRRLLSSRALNAHLRLKLG